MLIIPKADGYVAIPEMESATADGVPVVSYGQPVVKSETKVVKDSKNAKNSKPLKTESVQTIPAATVQAPAAEPAQASMSNRSIKNQPLYVHSTDERAGRPAEIYSYQVGSWFGNWTANVASEVNTIVTAGATAGSLPLLIAYNIPGRDCGSYSSGGAGSSAAYRTWIRDFAAGISNRKAIVILEPDALAQIDCLGSADQTNRIADIAYAVGVLRSQTQASVYIDGGSTGWNSVSDMVSLLKRAGIINAVGFALNVSNFQYLQDSVAYGEQISLGLATQGIPNVRYVIDTSRNGQGPAPVSSLSWCNPPGRGLGKRPTTANNIAVHTDALLWIKAIGESDGECGRGDAAAGEWLPEYAQSLIRNAVY